MEFRVPTVFVDRGGNPAAWTARLALYGMHPEDTVPSIAAAPSSARLYVFVGPATAMDLSSIRKLLRAGRRVLVQIPPTRAARDLVAEAASHGWPGLSVYAPEVFAPPCLEARRVLREGALGPLRALHHRARLDRSAALFHRTCVVVALAEGRRFRRAGVTRSSTPPSWRVALPDGFTVELSAAEDGTEGGIATCANGRVDYSLKPSTALRWSLQGEASISPALPDGDGSLYQLLDAIESVHEDRESSIWPPSLASRAYDLYEVLRRKGQKG